MSNVKSAFFWRTGEPSIFAKDPAFSRDAKTSQNATEAVEKQRAEGRDNSTIPGLSPKADELVAYFRQKAKKLDK